MIRGLLNDGLLIIAVLAVIYGCLLIGEELREAADKKAAQPKPTRLKLVTLDNGMPCVKYIQNGGITCDWDFKTRAKL